jgi:hypothetical protein
LCTRELKRVVEREREDGGQQRAWSHNFGSSEVSARGACPLLVGGAIAALVVEATMYCICLISFWHCFFTRLPSSIFTAVLPFTCALVSSLLILSARGFASVIPL